MIIRTSDFYLNWTEKFITFIKSQPIHCRRVSLRPWLAFDTPNSPELTVLWTEYIKEQTKKMNQCNL